MTYTSAPPSVRSLEQRIRNVGGSTELSLRRRVSMTIRLSSSTTRPPALQREHTTHRQADPRLAKPTR